MKTIKNRIQTSWQTSGSNTAETKEMLGGSALFKWCCWRSMRRILLYIKDDGKIRLGGTGIPFHIGHYCEVCERRVENTDVF